MKRAIAVMAVLCVLLVSAVSAQYVTPGSPSTMDSGASVQPGVGNSPVVEYVWVLPDENDVEEGTQLEVAPSGERRDIYACIVVSDVESRDTIEDVFIDVFHPDGSKKYQVHAFWLDPNNEGAEIESCVDDGVAAGLLTTEEANDIIYWTFDQPGYYVYKVFLPMYYHQPAGEYEARAYATDSTSMISSPLSTWFDWVPGTYLELDFNTVDFGSVQPGEGIYKYVHGDTDMSTPDHPTVKNEGNTEVFVGVEFSEFRGDQYDKVIDDFDAQLRSMRTADNYNEELGEHLFFNANQFTEFTYPISLCRTEKLDFSIHADSGLVPDTYSGQLTVFARPNVVDSPAPGTGPFPVGNDLVEEISVA